MYFCSFSAVATYCLIMSASLLTPSLARVLDDKLKREKNYKVRAQSNPGSSRKRSRYLDAFYAIDMPMR